MAALRIYKLGCFLFFIIIYLLSYFLLFFNLLNLKYYYNKCLNNVTFSNVLDGRFVDYLILGEDRRSKFHYGIDYISIVRVLLVRLKSNKIQGGSTIEQQFVRLSTGLYMRTIQRKVMEYLLVTLLLMKFDKDIISNSYLMKAYFGYGVWGLTKLANRHGLSLENTPDHFIIFAVSSLKYPEPKYISPVWHQKIKNRIEYISARYANASNSF